MPKCPFCKNDIIGANSICPHCQRILIEKIIQKQQNPQPKRQPTLFPTDKKFNFSNLKKYIPILALLLIILFIGASKDDTNTDANQAAVPATSYINDRNQLPRQKTPSPKDPKDYVSLSNGTILFKNPHYLNGLGKLKIENGTSLDAIAKLISVPTDKSVFTVYIKARNIYNISKIKDGNYKLIFSLGNDWNAADKKFILNSAYEAFENLFDFTTREYEEGDYIRTRYSVFEVTLNPVLGGRAKTEDISEEEFARY